MCGIGDQNKTKQKTRVTSQESIHCRNTNVPRNDDHDDDDADDVDDDDHDDDDDGEYYENHRVTTLMAKMAKMAKLAKTATFEEGHKRKNIHIHFHA